MVRRFRKAIIDHDRRIMVADGGSTRRRVDHDGSGGGTLSLCWRELLLGQLVLAFQTLGQLLALGTGRAHARVLGGEEGHPERGDDTVGTHSGVLG